jgi:glutamine amidotransferase
MRGLLAVGGDEIIRERVERGNSTLGICVGMQILFSAGAEPSRDHSTRAGVGIWEGTISKLNAPILPHMGWNTVTPPPGSKLFRGIESESFYFVHSYAAKSVRAQYVTWSEYGEPFVAALEDEGIAATQFHPEKSGRAGLSLIRNWVETL